MKLSFPPILERQHIITLKFVLTWSFSFCRILAFSVDFFHRLILNLISRALSSSIMEGQTSTIFPHLEQTLFLPRKIDNLFPNLVIFAKKIAFEKLCLWYLELLIWYLEVVCLAWKSSIGKLQKTLFNPGCLCCLCDTLKLCVWLGNPAFVRDLETS